MSEYITLKKLAGELGLDRSNMRKYVKRQGFYCVRVRTPESRGQLTLALTNEDAEAIREIRARQGFGASKRAVIEDGKGYFYIVQVVPDLDAHRVKLGFAKDAEVRLAAHRTSAPTAKLVRTWPCRRAWEPAIIASITRTGCRLIASEVYECDGLHGLVDRTEALFEIMPRG